KVEASKFTEIGYVGRDVEGMVRDLVDSAIDMVRTEREGEIEDLAHEKVEERLLDLLLPPPEKAQPPRGAAEAIARPGEPEPGKPVPDNDVFLVGSRGDVARTDPEQERYQPTRDHLR